MCCMRTAVCTTPDPVSRNSMPAKAASTSRSRVAWHCAPGYGSIDEPGPLAPENSLAAFAAAAEAGYGIELDVQLTLDNKAVVCHDPDLLRVAGDPRNIRDLTYDELVRIPLFPTAAPGAEVSPLLPGATENPPLVTTPSQAPAGYYQHVPLLEDVLRVVDGRVPIIVEFKFENYRTWDDRDEELMADRGRPARRLSGTVCGGVVQSRPP